MSREGCRQMRLHFGRVPHSPDFSPDKDGWTPLREPKVWMFQVVGAAAGIMAAIGVFHLWRTIMPALPSPPEIASKGLGFLGLAAVVAAVVIIVHEAMHLAAHPGGGTRRISVLGIWLPGLAAYAHYDGPMSRNRFVAIVLLPFVTLSLGSLAVCAAAGLDSPLIAACSILNSALAGGDLVTAALVLSQVPAPAEVRNQGWWTWWRCAAADTATDLPP